MRTIILGAGVSGRMAAYLIPSLQNVTVLEQQAQNAQVLTMDVGCNYLHRPIDVGVPYQQIHVTNTIDGAEANPESVARYAQKVGLPGVPDWRGRYTTARPAYKLTGPIPLSAKHIRYQNTVIGIEPERKVLFTTSPNIPTITARNYDRLISTIPLPYLLGIMRWQPDSEVALRYAPLYLYATEPVSLLELPGDEMYVDFITNVNDPMHRRTTFRGVAWYESLAYVRGYRVANTKLHVIRCGRILRPLLGVTKVLHELANMDVYCFGRFATWDPNENVHNTYENLCHFFGREINYEGSNAPE